MKKFLAHLTKDGREHDLLDHLESVANLSKTFALRTIPDLSDLAYVTGLLHDYGKTRDEFQNRIRVENGLSIDSDVEEDSLQSKDKDHSTAGAIKISCEYPDSGIAGIIAGHVIFGHHAGLHDNVDFNRRRSETTRKLYLFEESKARAVEGGLEQELISRLSSCSNPWPSLKSLGNELALRQIFSIVCDADFLDTESFYDSSKSTVRSSYPPLDTYIQLLNSHLEDLTSKSSSSKINHYRSSFLRFCLESANDPSPVKSLVVPTGAGKTKASLAYALNYAKNHGKDRVIYVVPRISITEQTASEFKKIFGVEEVVEFHSALGDRASKRNYLAAENFDAPLIVTTSVQVLESLFSHKTSRARKNHNIANSVLVFDETHLLPDGLLIPIMRMLKAYVEKLGTALLFCSATLPSFDRIKNLGNYSIRGVVPCVPEEIKTEARDTFRRVEVDWSRVGQKIGIEHLAGEVVESESSTLVISQVKRDAFDIFCEFKKRAPSEVEVLHLSTLMCSKHRLATQNYTKSLLAAGKRVVVSSTQLVEVGVDLDFPQVYKAVDGLDSISQAAGRCNREGKLSSGKVVVYEPYSNPPPGKLEAITAFRVLFKKYGGNIDIYDEAVSDFYFSTYYSRLDKEKLDKYNIEELTRNRDFKTVSKKFSIVEEDGSGEPVFIPFDDKAKSTLETIRGMEELNRWVLRSMQPYTVNVREKWLELMLSEGLVEEVSGVHVLKAVELYDRYCGLAPLVFERLSA